MYSVGGKHAWRLKWDLSRDPRTGTRITRQKTVVGTKREAEAELARVLGAIQAGRYVDPTKMAVGELLAKWRDEVASVSVAAKTLERYCEHVDRLTVGLGSIPLTQLHPLTIQDFYTELRQHGHKQRDGGLSEQTLLHVHRVLCAALSQAVSSRLIPCSPAENVKAPRPLQTEMRTLNEAEMRALLAAAEETSLYVPILLWLTTALRRGELLGLLWRDFDRAQHRLTIVRTLEETKQGVVMKPPKTMRSSRVLPLPAVVVEALHAHELRQKQHRLGAGTTFRDRGLIFSDSTGEPQRPRNVTKAFAALVRRAGLPKISIHGLRHTHITELLRAGVHPKVVSERAGHSSVAFTLQRYAHALPDMQRDAADQAQRLVGKLVER